MKDIPPIIKAARIRQGFTQQELGERMGYNAQVGNRENPRSDGENSSARRRSQSDARRPDPLKLHKQIKKAELYSPVFFCISAM